VSFAPGTVHMGWKVVTRASSGPAPRFKVEKGGQKGILQAFPFKGANGPVHQELAERLRRWQGVTHPELVATDVDLQDRAALVVFPLLDALPSEAYEAQKAVQILQVIARALVPFHKKGVAHGELSPASVRVEGARRVLLPPSLQPPQPGVLRLGIETDPRYAAPEVLDGRLATPRSDMFSVGLIFYRLLTGDAPTKTQDPADSFAARGAEPAPALKADTNPALKALYAKLTALREEQRPQDAEELVADLEALVGSGKAPQPNKLPGGAIRAVSIGGPLFMTLILGGLLAGVGYYTTTFLKPVSPVAEYVFPPEGKPAPEASKTQ
jgi:protein kinase-like protein